MDAVTGIIVTVAGKASDVTEGAVESAGESAEGTRLPRRCISRETSLESYVRP